MCLACFMHFSFAAHVNTPLRGLHLGVQEDPSLGVSKKILWHDSNSQKTPQNTGSHLYLLCPCPITFCPHQSNKPPPQSLFSPPHTSLSLPCVGLVPTLLSPRALDIQIAQGHDKVLAIVQVESKSETSTQTWFKSVKLFCWKEVSLQLHPSPALPITFHSCMSSLVTFYPHPITAASSLLHWQWCMHLAMSLPAWLIICAPILGINISIDILEFMWIHPWEVDILECMLTCSWKSWHFVAHVNILLRSWHLENLFVFIYICCTLPFGLLHH